MSARRKIQAGTGAGPTKGPDGFSLIEIALAMLVFSLGVVVVFGLFPFAMEAGRQSVRDTHVSMFGRSVLEGLRANAAKIDNWNTWSNFGSFSSTVFTPSIYPNVSETGAGVTNLVPYPTQDPTAETWVRYTLSVSNDVSRPDVRSFVLNAAGGLAGEFRGYRFYTEVYYQADPTP